MRLDREGLTERAAATCLVAALLAAPSPGLAEPAATEIGGDLYITGHSTKVEAERDVFALGISTAISGNVAEDTHAVGFSVEVDADTEGDLYATGGSVSIRGGVGSDLTVSGGTIRTHPSSVTRANARLTGGSINVEGPVMGALVASGGDIYLNAEIGGDAHLSGARIRFGPNASVAGQLSYATRVPVDVPETVAAPERVKFERLEIDDFNGSRNGRWNWSKRPDLALSPGAVVGALAATIGSFLLVGAIFLAFTPNLVSRMRKDILARPGRTALLGLVGLSLLVGCVPILAMTLVGIPLVPIAILGIILVWFLGYVLGAYSLGMGVARSFGVGDDPSTGIRLAVLAVAALAAALLNFIPFLGWLANLLIVLLGTGAMARVLSERLLPGSVAESAA